MPEELIDRHARGAGENVLSSRHVRAARRDRHQDRLGDRRKAMVEDRFGHMKHNLRWRRFMRRGLRGLPQRILASLRRFQSCKAFQVAEREKSCARSMSDDVTSGEKTLTEKNRRRYAVEARPRGDTSTAIDSPRGSPESRSRDATSQKRKNRPLGIDTCNAAYFSVPCGTRGLYLENVPRGTFPTSNRSDILIIFSPPTRIRGRKNVDQTSHRGFVSTPRGSFLRCAILPRSRLLSTASPVGRSCS